MKYIRKAQYKYKTSDNYQLIYYSLFPIIHNKELRSVLVVFIYLYNSILELSDLTNLSDTIDLDISGTINIINFSSNFKKTSFFK